MWTTRDSTPKWSYSNCNLALMAESSENLGCAFGSFVDKKAIGVRNDSSKVAGGYCFNQLVAFFLVNRGIERRLPF